MGCHQNPKTSENVCELPAADGKRREGSEPRKGGEEGRFAKRNESAENGNKNK